MLGTIETAIAFALIMLGISLLITLLVQVVSAILSSRGANLRWGIKMLFQQIDPSAYPKLAANAKVLSEKILTHCLLSDSVLSSWPTNTWTRRLQLATAIRPQELVAVLKDIAADPEKHKLPKDITMEIDKLLAAQNPVAQRGIGLVHAMVPQVSGVVAAQLTPVVEDAVRRLEQAQGKLEVWFDSMMDRVSQRFRMHMRLWTVAFALFVVLVARVDALRILTDLNENTAARQTLAGQASAMLAAAESILEDKPVVHASSLKEAAAEQGVTGITVPDNISTYGEASRWIEANVTQDKQAAVLDAYRRRSDVRLRAYVAEQTEKGKAVRALLGGTDIRIVPSPYPAWNELGVGTSWLGLLITTGLLSLGAPFWFNALKTLTNLRPVVAEREKQSGR